MQIIFDEINGDDEVYMDCLRAICGNTERKSMSDLGCNLAPYTPRLGFEKRTYVDIIQRKLDHEEEQKYFILADELEYLSKLIYKQLDITFSLDNIEHLSYEDGKKLLNLMEWTSKKQILFTPLDAWMVTDDVTDKNPEAHRSLWKPENLNREWATIVFTKYHQALGIGAWFGWKCDNIQEDFERVINELNKTSWAKLS